VSLLSAILDHLDKIGSVVAAVFAVITFRAARRQEAASRTAPSPGPDPSFRWTPRQLRRAALAGGLIFVVAVALTIVRLSRGGEPDPRPTTSATAGPVPSGIARSPDPQQLFHYLEKAGASGEDIDVDVGYKGNVVQRFTATSDRIGSVAVIVSRVFRSGEGAVEGSPGRIRLTLHRVNTAGDIGGALPISLRASGVAPSPDGVVVDVSPGHRDTVIRVEDVPVEPGDGYALRITMEEPGAIMAISLRPVASPGNAMDVTGLVRGRDFTKRTDRAVAGYVCRAIEC
jgi:hypothetical protein